MAEQMILLENVMPVEIALKREQEYRKKVEALLSQQQCDSENGVSHLKERLRNLSGTKRKEPSTDVAGPPSLQPPKSSKAFQKQPAGLLCLACEVVFSTFYYLKQHCATQAHKEKLFQTRRGKKPVSNPLWCELCNVPSSSEISLESHLNGIKHATALQELENAKAAKLGRQGEAGLQLFSEKLWN